MINVIIIDKLQNNRTLLSSYFEKIEDTAVSSCLENFDALHKSEVDLKQIDLIIFDITSKEADKLLEEVKKLKTKFENLNFIASSYEINSELTAKTLKGQVCEFLLKPIIPNILEAAVKKIRDLKNKVPLNCANTICVFSNKGGIGKTSLAVNTAFEIAKQTQHRVCLLDLSFNSADISTFLNIEPKYGINFILNNIETSDEKLLLSVLNRYEDSNLYVFSPQDEIDLNLKFTPHNVTRIINAMKNIFSYIVIDTASVPNETSVSILNNSDMVLLLGMMNLASVRNIQKCLELFENIGLKDEKTKLILNRFIEKSEITLKDIEKTTGKEVFFKIPNNYLTLIDAINLGKPVGEINPQSNIAKAYSQLAKKIINTDFLSLNEAGKTSYNHGIFNLLRRMGE